MPEHSCALSGTLLREKKEIPFSKFPVEVQETLTKYGRNKIKASEVVKFGNEIYCQAQLKRFWFDKKLVLDTTGKQDPTFSYWD